MDYLAGEPSGQSPHKRRFFRQSFAQAALCRPRRVMVLLIGIVVLSLADLVITLTHLGSTGMAEANPVARFIIQSSGSPVSLVCFKAITVLLCVALLYKVRNFVQAEIAAWCGIIILSYMSILWFHYARHYENPVEIQLVQSGLVDAHWVQFD